MSPGSPPRIADGKGEVMDDKPLTSNQEVLEGNKRRLLSSFPAFAPQLFAFLERDESKIAYARVWGRNLGALRLAPSPSITAQFDISLEIPVLIATFEGDLKLEPRILRQLDTSTELRASASADKDIAVLVASDPRAHDFVRDRKRFAFPVLVLETARLEAGEYSATNLRSELANLLRSINHFDYSNEIRGAADFFGRLDEIDALTALASSGQSAGVFGLRRAGKTSLLYQVRDSLTGRGVACIYVQLNALVDDEGFRDAILRELGRLLSDRGVATESRPIEARTSAREWVYRMDALLDQLDADVVILIDEVDLANEDAAEYDDSEIENRKKLNRVMQQLRGVIQIRNDRGKNRLSFLAAGVASSIFTDAIKFNKDNQLFGFASARPLGPMSRDEMREMVRTLGKRSGMKFNSYKLFDLLFAEYGGHPHLTRQACSALVEEKLADRKRDVPYVVQPEDLELIFKRTGDGSPAYAAWQTLRSFERWYPDEASRVIEVARSGRPCSDPAEIAHAIGFGLCNESGSLRVHALARLAM